MPHRRQSREPGGAGKSRSRELVQTGLSAAVLFLVLRTFVVQAFRIPSPSMEDTLLVGDFLFISKLDYGARVPLLDARLPGWRAIRRGDVVVFRLPEHASEGGRRVDYIKRVVAVAGQTVEVRHKRLHVDGEPVSEPYVKHLDPTLRSDRDEYGPLEVPPGTVFVLGDNRDFSNDSRFWGPLPTKNVHGRALIRYFSWDPESKWIRFKRLFTLVR